MSNREENSRVDLMRKWGGEDALMVAKGRQIQKKKKEREFNNSKDVRN